MFLVNFMNKSQNFIVNDNVTLLSAIANFNKDLSNKTIKNYIKYKKVMVNDKVITNSSFLLNKGDNVIIS